MYSAHNKGKSVVVERFIRTLKNKICKHMTAISKNVYFDVLNTTIHTIKLLMILSLNIIKNLMKKTLLNLK